MSASPESYPRPAVPYEGHSDLYFATERQIRSSLTLAGTDRGELTLAPGRVRFRGMQVEVDCPNVAALRLVPKAFPWGTALAVGIVAAVLTRVIGPVQGTWWRGLPVALIYVVVCVRQVRERWVEVVYSDGVRTERRAYFRRQPGFGSSAARTRRLLAEMERQVLGDESGMTDPDQS